MAAPSLRKLKDIMTSDVSRQLADGSWVPARSEGYPSLRSRFRLAYMVFTGRADALVWPEDEV